MPPNITYRSHETWKPLMVFIKLPAFPWEIEFNLLIQPYFHVLLNLNFIAQYTLNYMICKHHINCDNPITTLLC